MNTQNACLIAVAFVLLTSLAGRAVEPAPSPLDRFSPEQQKQLIAGEAVFEYVMNQNPAEGEATGHGQATALINRPPARVMAPLTDWEHKREYFPRLAKSEVVKKSGGHTWVREHLDFTIAEIVYVIEYWPDAEGRHLYFRVDKSYDNDISDCTGYYILDPLGEQQTLFTYAVTRLDVGIPVPEFVSKALSSRDLPGVAAAVKKRAESDGKWKKED